PVHPHVGDDQVAGVPADLVYGELGGRLDQGWQRHGDSVGRSITTVVLLVTVPRPFSFRDTRPDPRDEIVPVTGQALPGVGAGAALHPVGEVDGRRALPSGDAQGLLQVGAGHTVHEVAEPLGRMLGGPLRHLRPAVVAPRAGEGDQLVGAIRVSGVRVDAVAEDDVSGVTD